MQDAVAALAAQGGPFDGLVAAAGIVPAWHSPADLDLADFDRTMAVNVRGFVVALKCVAGAMPAGSTVVAIGSLNSWRGDPHLLAYAASKHAMIGFFDSLRIELAGSGVDVSVIAPDFVVSEIHKRAIGPDGEPLGESPMVKSKIMTAEACARRIARAIERRERQVLMSARGKLGRWLKLLAPSVIDSMAAKAIRQRH